MIACKNAEDTVKQSALIWWGGRRRRRSSSSSNRSNGTLVSCFAYLLFQRNASTVHIKREREAEVERSCLSPPPPGFYHYLHHYYHHRHQRSYLFLLLLFFCSFSVLFLFFFCSFSFAFSFSPPSPSLSLSMRTIAKRCATPFPSLFPSAAAAYASIWYIIIIKLRKRKKALWYWNVNNEESGSTSKVYGLIGWWSKKELELCIYWGRHKFCVYIYIYRYIYIILYTLQT